MKLEKQTRECQTVNGLVLSSSELFHALRFRFNRCNLDFSIFFLTSKSLEHFNLSNNLQDELNHEVLSRVPLLQTETG